jgi:O-antigen/teichoic acid export membrane protein
VKAIADDPPQPAGEGRTRDGLPRRMAPTLVATYTAEVVNAVAALVATPLLLHRLGSSAFGVWVLAGSVILYLELFEFGFGAATTKLIAGDAGVDDGAVARTVNTSIAILTPLGLVALVAGLLVAVFAPTWFSISEQLDHEAVVVFGILAVSLAISIPLDTFGGALMGHQRSDLLSMTNLVLNLLTNLAAVTVVTLGGGLVPLALAAATISIAMHPVRWRLLKRLVPSIRLSFRLVDRSRIRPTASTSGWFLLRDLASVAINRIDLLVVGVALSVREVALYAIGLKLAQLGQKALLPLAALFFPHASSIARRGSQSESAALLLDGTRIAMLAGMPIMLALALLSDLSVRAWVGQGHEPAAAVLICLAVGRGLMSISETPRGLLAGSGHIKPLALLTVAEAVTNLALSVALVRPLGVAGVALGTTLAFVLVSLPTSVRVAGRLTGVTLRRLFTEAFAPHLLPLCVTTGMLLLARRLLPAGSPLVLPAAVLAVVLYLVCYGAVGAPRSDRERMRGGARTLLRLVARRPA